MTSLRALVDRTLEACLALLMAGMVLAVLWQVVTRFALREPSSVTEEVVRFGLLWVSLLGAGYGFGRRAHLAIDLLPRSLSPRRRAHLDLVIQIGIATFALLLLVLGGARLVALTLALGQTSAALQMQRGYVYLALPLSGLVICFYSAAHVLEGLASLRKMRGA